MTTGTTAIDTITAAGLFVRQLSDRVQIHCPEWPTHANADASPSAVYYLASHRWKCSACGAHGTWSTLQDAITRNGPRDASLGRNGGGGSAAASPSTPLQLATEYEAALARTASPDAWAALAERTIDQIAVADLVIADEHGRVGVPVVTTRGELCALHYRSHDAGPRFLTQHAIALPERAAKMLAQPRWSMPRDGWIVLCEGLSDYLCACQWVGADHVVACQGIQTAAKLCAALPLTGITVAIAVDTDAESTRALPAIAAAIEKAGGIAVRVDLGDAKDVCEYSAAGGDFAACVEQARRTDICDFDLVLTCAPSPPRWLADGFLATESCAVFGGEPKLGKTWALLHAALCACTGRPMFDRFVVRNPVRRVMVYSPEGSSASLANRLHQLCHGMLLDPSHVRECFFRIRERLDFVDGYARIVNTVRRLQPDILIIDPFISIFGGDENSAGEIQAVLNRIRDLRAVQPSLSIWVSHHSSKGHRGQSLGYGLRGSSALQAWLDTLVTIRDGEGGVRRVDVQHRDSGSPLPFGFTISASGEVVQGLSGIRIESCDAPKADAQPAPKSVDKSMPPWIIGSVS